MYKTSSFVSFVFAVGLLVALLAPGVHAQATATATIEGTVTDQTGATIAGAQVVAKSKATASTRTSTSNDSGFYRFEQLPVGAYSVTATKSGFATYIANMEIMVGQISTPTIE